MRQSLIHPGRAFAMLAVATATALIVAVIPGAAADVSTVPSDVSSPASAAAVAPSDLTFAVSTGSTLPRNLTTADVEALYRCQVPDVRAYLPEQGSAVRDAWLELVGLTEADVRGGGLDCIIDTAGNESVSENDGRNLRGLLDIVPYSVPVFLAQKSGLVQDVTGQAILGSIDDQAPITMNTASVSTVSFAVSRDSSLPARLTSTELRAIYRCEVSEVTPYLPPPGSDLRAEWLAIIDVTESEIAQTTCLITNHAGVETPDNDGRVLADHRALVPYRIPTFLDQQLGRTVDVSASARLGTIDGLEPFIPSTSAHVVPG